MENGYVTAYYGCQVFDDREMKKRLSARAYADVRKVIEGFAQMTIELADEVATELRDWALERGATHYTHWFQPMTGLTAEKHDAFITPLPGGGVTVELDGRCLVKGETDASSFPSGGLRATFEARGYTTWDCTSPPFVRVDPSGARTLCIPTAFCSYAGEALDEKTPLLRSMDAISRQAVRVLHALGHTEVQRVVPTVGGEQEYFLIDKSVYQQREDLIYAGRTLFGAPPAKGQELEDQYYAAMSERVATFMVELNEELWKLGVPAKTQHYEVAPAQYELAPVFSTANIAVDHNQIAMEMLKKVADRHGFACLLHEKPFAHINGSGKHNNWGLSTDTGRNLLKPAKIGQDNSVFLAFFAATIAAVDEYADALIMSCASLANEARLGGHEAPPAIVSVFVGEKLEELIAALKAGNGQGIARKEEMTIGVTSLPMLLRDDADRNRTSPFAFTGNKFEFRMAGSSQSLGLPNTVLNTAVADMLRRLADALDASLDPQSELYLILGALLEGHERVLFSGDNYAEAWRDEAKKRGLTNMTSALDAFDAWHDEKLVRLFASHNVFMTAEMDARWDVAIRAYAKHAAIETRTMVKMSKQKLLPAAIAYSKHLARAANEVAQATGTPSAVHRRLLDECCERTAAFDAALRELEALSDRAEAMGDDLSAQARFYAEAVIPQMGVVRACVDELEKNVSKQYWPLPSYGEMLLHIV